MNSPPPDPGLRIRSRLFAPRVRGAPPTYWPHLALFVAGVALGGPPPARAQDTWTTPYPGVRHLYRRASGPRRMHALVVDLCHAGVSIRATRSGEKRATVSAFASAVGAEAATNGDFFSYTTYDPSGAAMGNGVAWGHHDSSSNGLLAFGAERVDLSPPSEVVDPLRDWMRQVVGGHPMILRNGEVVANASDLCTTRNPRTAAGFSRDWQTLYLMVVDGRSSVSIGMTCAEEARFLAELGAWNGINMDGGGSSTMWIRGSGVVNVPSDGAQRVVSNHLAIQASGSGRADSCRPWEPEEAATLAQVLDDASSTDIDGDGRADLCARSASGLRCHLASDGGLDPTAVLGPALSDDNGWADPTNHETIAFGDVTGDGLSDVCARANAGMRCWASMGTAFASHSIVGPELSDAGGWDAPARYATIRLADVNGDGLADVCGRAGGGFRCWPSLGDGFGDGWAPIDALSDANGFADESRWSTVRMGDVDGDGRVDVCARTETGFSCWRSTGASFDAAPIDGPSWSDENGWDAPASYLTIRVADVNGDGLADVCARANAGFRCHLSTGIGFGGAIALDAMTNEQGWNAYDQYSTIRLADIDGDGDRDVCGRGANGIVCYRFEGSTWGERVVGPELSNDEGWARAPYYRTIRFADLDGDGTDDLCARSSAGMWCWLGGATGFGPRVDGPLWADGSGWLAPKFHGTIRLSGPFRAPAFPPAAPPPAGSDAGAPSHPDGGVTGGDASILGAPPDLHGGCSVASTGARGWFMLLLLAALAAGRVGRRRRGSSALVCRR